jgi:glycine reductase complex component B subunit gamma
MAEMGKLRVAHYLNQFFAGAGGEEAADLPPEVHGEALGPGRALAGILGDAGDVVSSFVCGDDYFNEHTIEAEAAVREWLEELGPDLVVAGPAFAAGRYGVACSHVCRVADDLDTPAVTGLHPENPGRLVYARAYAVPAPRTAAGMKDTLEAMVELGRRLAAGVELGPAEAEGYLPRSVRRPGHREKPGAERAVDMLVAKLGGRPFRTEIPVEAYDAVPPAPAVADPAHARIGLVTSGAIVPKGNPDRLRRASESRWVRYSIAELDGLRPDDYECVHGGFFNMIACENPNLVLPLDAVRELQREGAIGSVADFYCCTSGNDQRLADCARNGREIASALAEAGVEAAILVAT